MQIAVLPITDRINGYALEVADELKKAGFRVESNTRSDKIGAKIREATVSKIPFMLVLGDKELESNKVAVRERVSGDKGVVSLDEFIAGARRLNESRAISNDFEAD